MRQDKINRIMDLAIKSQEAAEAGNLKEIYRLTKQLVNKTFANYNAPIRSKNDTLLTSNEEQIQIWHDI